MVVRPLIAEKISPHQGTPYGHNYSHTHEHDNKQEHSHSHLHKSAFTGALQGLGGSATLMLVTLSTVNSVMIGTAFLFIFGVGVILGMVGVACLVGSVIAYTASNLEKVHKLIKVLTGSASIVFGIAIIVYALV
jgi:hypothetical protein